MVTDIVNGISVKLNKTFGDDFTIYAKNTEQGLKEPCFFIKLLTVLNTPFIGKRKRRDFPFDIHFFPVDDTDNEAIMAIGEKMADSMEFITLLNGDVMRGKDITFEIIDGVLHFNITYSVFQNEVSVESSMETITSGVKV